MLMLFAVIILGLMIGSFLNALVWRLHQNRVEGTGDRVESSKLSIVRGRSMCPNCRHQLAAVDLIPVVSWLILGGRCRYCRRPISWQYPAVELLTAGLFGLSYVVLQPVHAVLSFGLWLAILAILIALAVYDLRWMLLPDVMIGPAVGLALLLVVINAATLHSFALLQSSLLAAFVAGGAFYALAAVSGGKWMGGGDIKLAFLMGLLLGLGKTALAMALGFNAAAVIGVGLIVLGIKKRSDHIPFGPFLAAATVVAYLYGGPIISWYLRVGLQAYP